jgi:hypothetical protein
MATKRKADCTNTQEGDSMPLTKQLLAEYTSMKKCVLVPKAELERLKRNLKKPMKKKRQKSDSVARAIKNNNRKKTEAENLLLLSSNKKNNCNKESEKEKPEMAAKDADKSEEREEDAAAVENNNGDNNNNQQSLVKKQRRGKRDRERVCVRVREDDGNDKIVGVAATTITTTSDDNALALSTNNNNSNKETEKENGELLSDTIIQEENVSMDDARYSDEGKMYDNNALLNKLRKIKSDHYLTDTHPVYLSRPEVVKIAEAVYDETAEGGGRFLRERAEITGVATHFEIMGRAEAIIYMETNIKCVFEVSRKYDVPVNDDSVTVTVAAADDDDEEEEGKEENKDDDNDGEEDDKEEEKEENKNDDDDDEEDEQVVASHGIATPTSKRTKPPSVTPKKNKVNDDDNDNDGEEDDIPAGDADADEEEGEVENSLSSLVIGISGDFDIDELMHTNINGVSRVTMENILQFRSVCAEIKRAVAGGSSVDVPDFGVFHKDKGSGDLSFRL